MTSPLSTEGEACHLLIVDDDKVDRARLRRVLSRRREPFVLREATTVREGLALLRSQAFDCALVDYRLPDGTALDLMAGLDHDASRRLPIVILTGLDDEAVALEALKRGAQDYITKDALDEHVLCRAIRYSIERLQVADLQRRLIHADRLISAGQLAAGVAHEINNPASYVLCNLEALEDQRLRAHHAVAALRRALHRAGPHAPTAELEPGLRELEQIVQEDAEMIEASLHGVTQISSIVGELKSFSRIGFDSIVLTELDAIVRSACTIAHHELRHRATLILDLGQPPPIAADHGKLVQVVTNVLLNAAQAIEPGAAERNEIRVSTRAHGDTVRITVQDSGAGIPAAVLPRVFEPFFTTKPRSTGTGLGLTLCLDLVRKHGGRIELDSEVGVGTRVEIVLPADTGLEPSAPSPSQAASSAGARRARVLIIDDEPLICRIYERILSPHHDVRVANGGRQGLDILRSEGRFDIVLCDIMMPDLDGIQLYERVSEESPELVQRFVFCTGGALTEPLRVALDELTIPVLDKPVTRRDLLSTISRVARTPPDGASLGPPM